MTCRRSKRRGKRGQEGLSNETGFIIHGCIGSVLINHLVVDPEQKKGGGPLSDEECMVVFAGGFEDERAHDGSQGGAQEETAGQLGGVALHPGGGFVFRYFSGAYTIIHF